MICIICSNTAVFIFKVDILKRLTVEKTKQTQMFQGGYAVIFKVSLCALLPFALRQIIDLCSSQKRGENLGLNLLLIQREQTIGEETPATWVLFYLFVIVQTLSLLLMIIEIL